MKFLIVASFLSLVATLAGCAVYTPGGSVVVDPGATVVVPAERGKFCPPGQAKKGNC
jgi:hypothetical protein